ncbi:MAG: right-handed parallel beta-helix repeat-containing protein, partial [Armatimonadetes bacterium]|nr:right-handed parallel beta-helix repeat-containing protein [Armatimonadota bacterium]
TSTRQTYAGGGIWICGVEYAPTLRSNTIADNRAPNGHGGGVYSAAASPVLENNQITGNQAGDDGGGLYFCGGGQPQILNNEITGNQSSDAGGGIHFDSDIGSVASVIGNTIAANTAGGAGGGIGCWGGSSPTIEQNGIRDNTARLGGGGVWCCTAATIRDNNIEGNTADGGGGIFLGGSGTIDRNVVRGNRATGTSGGGIFACGASSAPIIRANIITGNTANWWGGGIVCPSSSPTIEDNEITGNAAGAGGGILSCGNGRPTIGHNTIARNTGDGVAVLGGHATISRNSIYDNTELGIDLNDDGVTPNDPGDADTGPNDLLNFPEYRLARLANGQVTAYGVAPPNSTVEVFKAAPDPSRYGEGKEHLLSVTASASGAFEFTVAQTDLPLTATATDGAGNTSEFSHVNLPPTPSAGGAQTVEQTDRAGTPVTLDASGSYDADDDPLTFTWTEGETVLAGPTDQPTVEVTLQLGAHTITLTVTDAGGLSATDEVTVTVVDTTPPALHAPVDVTAEQTDHAGTPVDIGQATAPDNCDAYPTVTDDAPAVFPLGSTIVTWTATDASGNTTTSTQHVFVADTTPPTFALSVLQPTLWSPDHKLLLAATVTDVADVCDADPAVDIQVTSNEAINGPGDGNTDPDWRVDQVDGVWQVWLRAERDGGGTGRLYHVQATVTDDSGNEASQTVIIVAPHDKG